MTEWSSNHTDQQTIISRIEGKLNTLRTRTKPVTLYSASTPSLSQLNAAWGAQYSPQLYEEVQWLDSANNILRNSWLRLPDITTTASSGTLRPLQTHPTTGLLTKIDELIIGEAGAGVLQTLSNIPQTYRHLFLYLQVRDSIANTVATFGIRVNGLSATNYAGSWQGANSTFGLGTEQVALTSWQFLAPAATAARAYYFQGWARFPDYATTARLPRIHMRGATLYGNPYTTSTTTNYNYFGFYNAAAAITSLSIVSGTGFAAGTRLILYAI